MDKKRRIDSQNDSSSRVQETANHPLVAKLYDLVDEIKNVVEKKEGVASAVSMEYDLEAHLASAINACKSVIDNSENAVGKYLHNLCEEEPPLHEVKKMIDVFPEALLFKDEDGYIPIQTAAAYNGGERYVPFLAMEASRRNIGPERGGLLLYPADDQCCCILQLLVSMTEDDRETWDDETCIQAMMDLRAANLLLDTDYTELNLIAFASGKGRMGRLHYFLDTYPEVLSIPQTCDDLPIHPSNYFYDADISVFTTILTVGMKYYPENFGFLFKHNNFGARAITQAINMFGKENTLQVISNVISPNEDYPILHQVIRFTPGLIDDFVYRYPDAVYLKDRKGRHLLHVAAKSGLKLSPSLLLMIHSNKECIEKIDPVTNLYPFMLAATSPGRKKDLTTIYKLLSLRPEIISKCIEDDGTN